MAGSGGGEIVSVDGRKVKLTSLDRVVYPSDGTTKADVIAYFSQIAPVMLPHCADRAATRKRWVDGVGTEDHPGQSFFQKNLEPNAPDWVRRRSIEHSDHTNVYPLVNDRATLVWCAQQSALEVHVPQWKFGPKGAKRNPDRLVLDLDPGDGVGLPECAEVARLARAILGDMGLEPFPVTSGSKGIHLYAKLDGRASSDEISAVAKELARSLEADHPELVVSAMKRSLRPGKVFVDWSQNNANKTSVAPYSLRGRLRPTVAAPRTWKELASPTLAHLEFREVLSRVTKHGDLLAGLADDEEGSPEASERLEQYRSMRDETVTPEPMGGRPSPGGNSFVIQRHEARRLHWDFRLERDGVLVSWAIPKGPPTDPKRNHLAVKTEDHPLDYGSFEGVIPKGEYGAGTVEIWDAGTYELEKWRDDEVIVTLTGQLGGGLGEPRRFALIRTGGADNPDNWLIHLMAPKKTPEPARARRPDAALGTPPRSASTADTIRAAARPMLATPGELDEFTSDDDWSFEMKWDGIRIIAAIGSGTARLFTRNGNDVSVQYPDIAEVLASTMRFASGVVDGELVALDRAGRPSFSRLQRRMGVTGERDVARVARDVPVNLLLFDVLEVDGVSTTADPIEARRERLRESVREAAQVHVPDVFEGDVDAAVDTSRALRLEGLIAKRDGSRYRPGERSRDWVKLKHFATQEVVVAGWRPGKGARSGAVGSLLLGIPSDHGLEYVGRVGTGFSERELARITERLARMSRKTSPLTEVPAEDAADAHWVTPSLVGEVRFSDWTEGGRLRHPSWRGWRPDKDPSDVRRS